MWKYMIRSLTVHPQSETTRPVHQAGKLEPTTSTTHLSVWKVPLQQAHFLLKLFQLSLTAVQLLSLLPLLSISLLLQPLDDSFL